MEDRVLIQAAASYGTPFYLFDLDEFYRKVRETGQALGERVSLCYAMKANPFVVGALAPLVERIEVCSPGEFRICEREKLPMDQLVVSGVNKEREDIRRIVTAYQGQGIFTIESESQRRIKRKTLKI